MTRWLWPALLGVVAAIVIGVGLWARGQDPVLPADDALPDLPAVTLDGQRLTAAYLGDRPWVILVWLPG